MEHRDVARFFGELVAMLGAAKLFGALAQRVGQPAVLGELVAGVVLGGSVLGVVDPTEETIHLLAEIGVVILLFAIGLETDLGELVRVGGVSTVVAAVGVVLPFVLGYAVCRLLGLANLAAIVVGASLTATSVGITARVLSDLGRLQDAEGQVVLGAAILDDVAGLVVLTIVMGLTGGREVTVASVAATAALAVGFLAATLVLGRLAVPRLIGLADRVELPGMATSLAIVLAFGLAWLADRAGSALILGAFAAGLLLARTPLMREVEHGIAALGQFFVPIFFVAVGAAVDVRMLNPLDPAGRTTLLVGGLLIAAAVAGKFLAGYAPFWFQGRKDVVGVGMIPRGEVGLIFAQMGLAGGVLDPTLFGAVMLMVMATTFLAPPLLKHLLAAGGAVRSPDQPEGIGDLVTKP
jgi:Kef-type K+ transport system membrane component KefB